jgi:hypothetical protein
MVSGIAKKVALDPDALPESFDPRQALAPTSLLSGAGVTAAARSTSVTRKTVYAWLLDDPQFVALYNSLRVEMFESVRQSLLALAPAAVKTVRRILGGRGVSEETKLRAALALLAMTSAPPGGPTTAEDARVLHAERDAAARRRGMIAGLVPRLPVPRIDEDEDLDEDDPDDDEDDEDFETDPTDPAVRADDDRDAPLPLAALETIRVVVRDRIESDRRAGPGAIREW